MNITNALNIMAHTNNALIIIFQNQPIIIVNAEIEPSKCVHPHIKFPKNRMSLILIHESLILP